MRFEIQRNDMCVRDYVQHSTKSVQCLGGSIKDINIMLGIRLCVAAAAVLVAMV